MYYFYSMIPISKSVINQFISALGADFVRTNPVELSLYCCDGLRLHSSKPGCVLLPSTTEEIIKIIKV